MALTISTGFVVDDAIVVTENVTRYIEAGEHAAAGGAQGRASRSASPSSPSRVSLLAVFIPILLMGGIVGRLFREFAVTLTVAIAVSALISLTLTPMMASRLLRQQDRAAGRLPDRAPRASSTGCSAAYDRGARWVLRHQPRSCCWSPSGPRALTVCLYIVGAQGPLPAAGHRRISGVTDAPQDISFPAMKERQEPVNEVVRSRSGGRAHGRLHRRRRHAQHRQHLHPAQAAATAQADRRPDHRRAAPQARAGPGHHALPAVGAGRPHGRPGHAHAVPVHPAGRQPRRAEPVGAAGCSRS